MWLPWRRNKDDKEKGFITHKDIGKILKSYLEASSQPDKKQFLKDLKKLTKTWCKEKSGSRAGRAAGRQMAFLVGALGKNSTYTALLSKEKTIARAIYALSAGGNIDTSVAEFNASNAYKGNYRHLGNVKASQEEYQRRNYHDLKKTIDYFCDHSLKAAFVGRFGLGGGDIEVYNLIKRLYLLGLDDYVRNLRTNLFKGGVKTGREKIDLFFYNIYQLFDHLNGLEKPQKSGATSANYQSLEKKYLIPDAELKKLKKTIHNAARAYNADVRIINNRKQEAKDDSNGRKYSLISYNDKIIGLVTKQKTDLDNKKRKNRRRRLKIMIAAICIALIVAIGEGMVAAVLAGSLLGGIVPALLVFGLAAFLVNTLLFYAGIKGILRVLTEGPGILFKDENGKDISLLEKLAVSASFVLGFCGGLAYGFLSFFAAYSGAFAFALAVGLTANPIGVFVFAGFVAVTTGIAIFGLFAFSMADFIRERQYKKIGRRLKENFFIQEGENPGHYLVRVLVNSLFLLAGVVLSVILGIALFGFFNGTSMAVLHGTLGLSATASFWITTICINIVAGITINFFHSKQILLFTEKVREGLRALKNGLVLLVTDPATAWKKVSTACSKAWRSFKKNPFRAKRQMLLYPLLGAIVVGSAINGSGYANGIVNEHGLSTVNSTTSFANLPPITTAVATRAGATIGSSFPNVTYSKEEIDKGLPPNLAKEGKGVEVFDEQSAPKVNPSSFWHHDSRAARGGDVFDNAVTSLEAEFDNANFTKS